MAEYGPPELAHESSEEICRRSSSATEPSFEEEEAACDAESGGLEPPCGGGKLETSLEKACADAPVAEASDESADDSEAASSPERLCGVMRALAAAASKDGAEYAAFAPPPLQSVQSAPGLHGGFLLFDRESPRDPPRAAPEPPQLNLPFAASVRKAEVAAEFTPCSSQEDDGTSLTALEAQASAVAPSSTSTPPAEASPPADPWPETSPRRSPPPDTAAPADYSEVPAVEEAAALRASQPSTAHQAAPRSIFTRTALVNALLTPRAEPFADTESSELASTAPPPASARAQAEDALLEQLGALAACVQSEQRARVAAESELEAERGVRLAAEEQLEVMMRELKRLRAEGAAREERLEALVREQREENALLREQNAAITRECHDLLDLDTGA